ncbi:MAG: hypothetical protein GWP15_00990 [Nitrospirae bacterium]|nr:hypothetical protein [Nitrospirota bacterium]
MNSEIEKKLWKKAEKYVCILRMVPFLRMVAVCNNLAFGKVDGNSDIDLFIIAKKGRLFIVRIFVTFLLHILGVRRHGEKVAGRFCLSFFVDEDGMDMRKIAIDNDIYLAFWVRTMVPVVDDGVSEEFLRVNSWVRRNFEEDFEIDRSKVVESGGILNRLFGWMLGGWFGNRVEAILKKWQMRRAKEKMEVVDMEIASLIVEDHILKFHNVDRRREYRKKWFDKYGVEEKLDLEKFLGV